MLGNALVRYFARNPNIKVLATVREDGEFMARKLNVPTDVIVGNSNFSPESLCALSALTDFFGVFDFDVINNNTRKILEAIVQFEPDVIINAVGVIKQNDAAKDSMQLVSLNTLLPHFLARLTKKLGSRLIHISTDCVFSGVKGCYKEADQVDAADLYGQTKYMGEVWNQRHVLTLRTSIIGHELFRKSSLLEWFLVQSGTARGYRKAIFSGLPTVELARIIEQYVLPNPSLSGLYHVSAESIDKFTLLQLIAKQYKKEIQLQAVDEPVIDRSLDSMKFRQATGYAPEAWPEMIRRMHAFG